MRKLFLTLTAVAALNVAGADWKYSVDPAAGTITKLQEVTVSFPNVDEIEINSSDDLSVTRNGAKVDFKASIKGSNKLYFALDAAHIRAGSYMISIPAGALAGYANNYAWNEDNEEISLNWTIAPSAASGDELDFSYVSSLPTDEYLAYFGELTLEFTGVDKVNYSGTGISVKHDGEELPDVAVTTDANKLTLTLKEALNFVDGKIEVAIAPESLTGVKGTVTAANLDPITAIYSMATPVVYDLTLLLNAPKINSAGEISADRSMSEMFFVCENKDLVAAAGAAPNVFLRSEEGDFEVSAHLTKGKGLNANYSYFVANFLKQPSYNGKYVITINKGAVGTAAWGEDPNYGHSNEALTLSFELVDGASRDIYSIQPISVTPSEGSYSKGSDIGVITFFFEEGISPVKGVSAMLAGIDTSYREETTFTATKDGGYALTFSPAPSEKGRYLLNVPQGAFGDAGFVANGDGKGSAPMSFTYYIGVVSGIEGIEETNPEAPHTIYNVQGLQIDSSIDKLPAGLYIIDGKKVVINKK